MKIFFDHQIFFHQKIGGISKYFYKLIDKLIKIEDVSVYLFQGLYQNIYDFSYMRSSLGFYLGWRKPEWIKFGKISRLVDKYIQFYCSKYLKTFRPDIFHPTYYRFPLAPPGTKTVLTVHDLIHELFPQYFRNAKYEISSKKKAIKSADALIAVSFNTKKDLINIYNVEPGKVFVVYHGVENSPNLPPEKKLALIAGLPKPYILFVGSRKLYKNFDCLLDAFRLPEMKNFGLVCAGGGSFTKEEENKLSKILVPKERVLQISGSDSLIQELYRNAFCFVFPSFYEGFGLPILEAMNSGCPAVISNASCFSEIGGDAAIYFDPKSPEDLVRSVLNLESDFYRAFKVEAGLKRAKLFTWEKTAQETYRVYKAVLGL